MGRDLGNWPLPERLADLVEVITKLGEGGRSQVLSLSLGNVLLGDVGEQIAGTHLSRELLLTATLDGIAASHHLELGFVTASPRFLQAHLRVCAEGESLLLAIDRELADSALGSSGSNQQAQAASAIQLVLLIRLNCLANLHVGEGHWGFRFQKSPFRRLIPGFEPLPEPRRTPESG